MPVIDVDYAYTLLPFGAVSNESACIAMMWRNVFDTARALSRYVSDDAEVVTVWHNDMVSDRLVLLMPDNLRVPVRLDDSRKAFDGLRLAYSVLLKWSVDDGSAAWLPDFALRDAVMEYGWMPDCDRSLVCLGERDNPCVGALVSCAL